MFFSDLLEAGPAAIAPTDYSAFPLFVPIGGQGESIPLDWHACEKKIDSERIAEAVGMAVWNPCNLKKSLQTCSPVPVKSPPHSGMLLTPDLLRGMDDALDDVAEQKQDADPVALANLRRPPQRFEQMQR